MNKNFKIVGDLLQDINNPFMHPIRDITNISTDIDLNHKPTHIVQEYDNYVEGYRERQVEPPPQKIEDFGLMGDIVTL